MCTCIELSKNKKKKKKTSLKKKAKIFTAHRSKHRREMIPQDQWQQRRANANLLCVTNRILGERDMVDAMSAMDDFQAGGVSICVRKEKREASQTQGQRKGGQR